VLGGKATKKTACQPQRRRGDPSRKEREWPRARLGKKVTIFPDWEPRLGRGGGPKNSNRQGLELEAPQKTPRFGKFRQDLRRRNCEKGEKNRRGEKKKKAVGRIKIGIAWGNWINAASRSKEVICMFRKKEVPV